MRAILLPLVFLLATPALAAVRTEEIRFKHHPAIDFERMLLAAQWPGLDLSRAPVAPGEQPARSSSGVVAQSLLPEGIVAWSVDAERNSLSVTGEAEAVEQVKSIVRLIDVPARRIRLSVTAFRPDAPTAGQLRAELSGEPEAGKFASVVVDDAKVRLIEAKPPLAGTEATVGNSRPLSVRLPWEKDQPASPGLFIPKLNGDGSLTVTAAVNVLTVQKGQPPSARQFTAVRLLGKGQGWILGSGAPDVAWLIVFRDVLADQTPAN
jgi:hypothetical protein